jgi:hypothetical protein
VIDELIDENTIRSNKIQFIFEESIRFEIDSIVVLSEVKNFRRIVCRWWFDDDHVDEQIENLLHENSINQKTMNLIWRIRLISVSSLQLVTRNVVTVNYVDAWIKWWMIFD